MAFTLEQRAAFDRLERSGYLPAVRQWIMSHTASVFWHDASGDVCHNGTLSFVDTGTAKLAITADHVFTAYLEDLAAGRVFECQFGGVPVRPEAMLIARDAKLDVATFRMPSVGMSHNVFFHTAGTWPPRPPAAGEWLFYAGYPGTHRVERSRTIDHGLETLFGPVTDVNGSTIAFLLDFEALHWPLHDHEAINQRLGGMSGGPVFRLIEEGLTRLEFVGIVYEHGETFELVFARSAAAICADGTLAT
jgi:hypothetical protein